MDDNRQRVITIAHPERCSGELKKRHIVVFLWRLLFIWMHILSITLHDLSNLIRNYVHYF